MLISLDSTNGNCSVALADDTQILDTIISIERNQQSKFLASFVAEICKRNNFSLQEISKILVTVGPGSFTGIRIGLSLALGLTITSSKELLAITVNQALLTKLTLDEYDEFSSFIKVREKSYMGLKFRKTDNIISLESRNFIEAEELKITPNLVTLAESDNIASLAAQYFLDRRIRKEYFAPTPIYSRSAF